MTRRSLHWLPLAAYPLALIDGLIGPWDSSLEHSFLEAAPMSMCCFSPVGIGMLVAMGFLLARYARGGSHLALVAAFGLWGLIEVGLVWIFGRAFMRYRHTLEEVRDPAERLAIRDSVIDETLNTNLTLAVAMTVFGLIAIVNAVRLRAAHDQLARSQSIAWPAGR